MTSFARSRPLGEKLSRLTPSPWSKSWAAPPKSNPRRDLDLKTVLPDHLSHSQCRTYADCSLQWWLSRRFASAFVPANLIFGSSIHSALECYYQARLEGRAATLDDLLAAFSKHWVDELVGKHGHVPAPVKYGAKQEGEAEFRELAEHMLRVFLEERAKQSPEVIAIEESFRVDLGSDLPPLVGKIDLIEIETLPDVTRRLALVDFKTAARRPTLDDLGADQLQLYGMAAVGMGLVQAFRLPLVLRYDILLKTKQPELLSLTVDSVPRDQRRLVEKIRQCWRGMSAGVVFPSGGWRCGGCGYARLCGAWPALPTLSAYAPRAAG